MSKKDVERLEEALEKQTSSKRPVEYHEIFGHFFHNTATPLRLSVKVGEWNQAAADSRRQLFLDGIRDLEMPDDFRTRIAPIVELASQPWTQQLIIDLADLEKKLFPGLDREARRKIRKEETGEDL